MEVVVGGVSSERIGNPDNDGALLGDRSEPLDRDRPPGVVPDLLEIADHQDRSIRKQRQSDPQQEQFQIG